MALEITGEMFRPVAERMMEAIELIPEEQRDFKIWEGTFKDAEGNDAPMAAMTPAELAADVVNAMTFFCAIANGEMELTPDSFANVRTSRDELASKPLEEIAAIGREKADWAVRQIDALTREQLSETVNGPRGPMPARTMAMLEFLHLIHHRAQLYTVLRALGVTPPGLL
ncbi:DinB family protein [bacterium]|nr:DinB family protein [bacterium]